MLSLLGRLLRFTFFATGILVAGALLRWQDKTLSEHVAAQLSRAQKTLSVPPRTWQQAGESVWKTESDRLGKKLSAESRQALEWAKKEVGKLPLPGLDLPEAAMAPSPVRPGGRAASQRDTNPGREPSAKKRAKIVAHQPLHAFPTDQPLPSERQKLKALIQELQHSEPSGAGPIEGD